MAGQPRAMLKKLDLFSSRAAALVNDLRRRMPRLYRERHTSGDPVADAWREAISSALDTWLAVDSLCAKSPLGTKSSDAFSPMLRPSNSTANSTRSLYGVRLTAPLRPSLSAESAVAWIGREPSYCPWSPARPIEQYGSSDRLRRRTPNRMPMTSTTPTRKSARTRR